MYGIAFGGKRSSEIILEQIFAGVLKADSGGS